MLKVDALKIINGYERRKADIIAKRINMILYFTIANTFINLLSSDNADLLLDLFAKILF
jgi:hypothetical protein|tara:strand:- start:4890 stop:5066 length:177 start_codon:yes stop_codon:yes gene_type:complete